MTFESPRRKPGTRPIDIEVNGRTFSFVTRQREDTTAIYKSDNSYIRIGDAESIQRDLALHRKMETAGFPVAKVIAEGTHNGEAYFIETSLGDRHLGEVFAKEIEQNESISDESFNEFLEVVSRFAKAQLTTATETKDFDAFSQGILLESLCEEMPECADRLRTRFEEVKSRAASFPFVLTHGDFSPNNLYPAGVIDLEDSFYGPYGYDVIGAISHIDSFPDSPEYEFFAKYRFTSEQKQKYLENLDAISAEAGLPSPTQFKDDFEFCRAVWLAAKIPHTPNLQSFRFNFIAKNFLG